MERTVGSNKKAKKDGATFHVALYAQKEYDIKEDSDSIPRVGWAVATKESERNEGADSFKVVLIPEFIRKLQDRNPSILSSPYLETLSSTVEEFKDGKPLTSLNTPIRACVGTSRPKLLYRVVHDEHPGNGLRSRGYGIIKTDQISFMLHFHYHLNWKSRNASPFMSATTDRAKANRIAH